MICKRCDELLHKHAVRDRGSLWVDGTRCAICGAKVRPKPASKKPAGSLHRLRRGSRKSCSSLVPIAQAICLSS